MKPLFILIIFFTVFSGVYAQIESNETFIKAMEKIDNREYAEAVILLRSIEEPADYLVCFNIGYCHYFMEEDDLAQAYFKKAIELNSGFVDSYGYLGMSYFFTNQPDKSEEMFLRCIEIRNNHFKDYYFLGQIYELKNKRDTAVSYYLEALKLNDSDFHTNYSLAVIYFDNDDFINAKKYFEICDAVDDSVYPVVNCLIQISYRQDDLDNVEELKQRLRVIRKESDDRRLAKLTRFTIDTFTYKDLHIFAEESFELSGSLYYHWVFRICDSEGNLIKTVNLESSAGLRALGTAYIVGMDQFRDGRRYHQTTIISFRQLPEYSTMKNIVIDEIENGLPVGASGVY